MKNPDLFIKGGTVFDGTGKEPYEADIGIVKDRIVLVSMKKGRKDSVVQGIEAGKTIDARGFAVSPGFIDTHAHSEFTLLADPRAEGKIYQGVTTEISGNCGLSAAPLYGEAYERREEDIRELGIKERWSDLTEYFSILRRKGIALNFATLAGHGNIRASVIGYKDRPPSKNELSKMRSLLAKTAAEGAIGLSTGLIYPPGVYSNTEELIDLCRVLSHNPKPPKGLLGVITEGIYTSHMRSEGNKLIEAIEEIISIGRNAGIKVHISHIKTSGRDNWHKIDKVISLIENDRRKGVRITCDRYPYTASSTDLDTILPSWTYEGGAAEELRRLRNVRIREQIKKEILGKIKDRNYWKEVNVSSVVTEKNRWMEGRSMDYISRKMGKPHIDAFFSILIEEKLRIGAIFFSMDENNLKRFLSLPNAMIGSDASARSFSGPTCKGKPHPRGFGSFPKFLGKYVRDEKLMPLTTAVHKITFLPAKTFGLKGRGIIREGAYADIVIFDPAKIIDRATFNNPFLRPSGIHYVIVNGVPVVSGGKFTGRLSGKPITRDGT